MGTAPLPTAQHPDITRARARETTDPMAEAVYAVSRIIERALASGRFSVEDQALLRNLHAVIVHAGHQCAELRDAVLIPSVMEVLEAVPEPRRSRRRTGAHARKRPLLNPVGDSLAPAGGGGPGRHLRPVIPGIAAAAGIVRRTFVAHHTVSTVTAGTLAAAVAGGAVIAASAPTMVRLPDVTSTRPSAVAPWSPGRIAPAVIPAGYSRPSPHPHVKTGSDERKPLVPVVASAVPTYTLPQTPAPAAAPSSSAPTVPSWTPTATASAQGSQSGQQWHHHQSYPQVSHGGPWDGWQQQNGAMTYRGHGSRR